jgi:adenylosuccinate synthase
MKKRDFASVDVLIGGQYGSEGKGVIAGYLAKEYDIAVRVGAPNAGHTMKYQDQTWKFQQIPVASIMNPKVIVCIGAAGLINLAVLRREMDWIPGIEGRLLIDRNAGILEPKHREQEEQESMFKGIGSTMEGVGAALRHKIKRDKTFLTAKDVPELKSYITDVAAYLNSRPAGVRIMIEGTQGFDLSLNHGPYPYCTGRDVLASSLLSDVGISPRMCDEIIMVVRTYPIRVAGNSGPMSNELSWEEVTRRSGYPAPLIERTTVTKRVRRVGAFDLSQVRRACQLNRPTQIVLTFADYITHRDARVHTWEDLSDETRAFVGNIEEATGVPVTLIKTGIEYDAIVDRRNTRREK